MRASQTNPTAPRTYVRAALVAMLITLSLAVPSIPQGEASTSSAQVECSYSSARVLGWIWGDGKYNEDGDWFFVRTKSEVLSNHMRLQMDNLGLNYYTGTTSSGYYTNRVLLPGYDETVMTENPMANPAIACDPAAFLASVIEGEGSSSGMVMDDPKASRRNGARAILDALHLDSYVSGQGVWIEAYDSVWLRSVPFAVCGRVPGGSKNCVLGQTP